MRPKRRVLLYCADEQRLSELSLVLDTRRYAVQPCRTYRELTQCLDRFGPYRFEAALFIDTTGSDHCEAMVRAVKRAMPETSVALWLCVDFARDANADAVFPVGARLCDVLERLRILCERKRGPKPLRGVLDASRVKAAA